MNLNIKKLRFISPYDDYGDIKEDDNIFLNGISPEFLDFVQRKNVLNNIFVAGDFNYKLLTKNYPDLSNRITKYLEKIELKENQHSFDYFVFEGESNFFSGISLATKILKEIDPRGEKSFYIPHHAVGRNYPSQFTSDFQEHMHSLPISWEDFYRRQVEWLPENHVLDPDEAQDRLDGNILIINPSISYFQPLYQWSLEKVREGHSLFASCRSAFQGIANESSFFESQMLYNYSPLSLSSEINNLLVNNLLLRLRNTFNV